VKRLLYSKTYSNLEVGFQEKKDMLFAWSYGPSMASERLTLFERSVQLIFGPALYAHSPEVLRLVGRVGLGIERGACCTDMLASEWDLLPYSTDGRRASRKLFTANVKFGGRGRLEPHTLYLIILKHTFRTSNLEGCGLFVSFLRDHNAVVGRVRGDRYE
jgi:hypothetical protein